MSLWKRIASRLRREEDAGAERAREPEVDAVGMTYADFERDKARKEALLSGVGWSDPDDSPSRRADEDAAETPGSDPLR